jgi:RND family efflux transporter MFP subunit
MLLLRRDLIALVGAFAVGLAACGGGGERVEQPTQQAPLVEAVETRLGALPIEEMLPGRVRASNQVAIRPEVEGRVVEVLVRSGEAVERGQPLVRLDGVEARERLRQAEADVELAIAAADAARARAVEVETRVARTRALAAEKLVSAQELESLEAQLEALRASAKEATARVELARAAAEERRSALAKTIVRAPVAGRLGERRVEVGMLVDPAGVLFVVGDLDQLIVEVNLTEEMLARVDQGQPVEIESRSEGPTLAAKMSRISPFLAEESFTTVGEVDLDNRERRLRPGMFVSVRILVGQSERAALVPVSAVWENPASGELGVFVVTEPAGLADLPRDSTASPEESRAVEFRPVAVLAEGRGAAGVVGVEQGEWVVTVGQHLVAAELRALGSNAGESGVARKSVRARVRPVSWERVAALQALQNEDLLQGFLDKQRAVAEAIGAEIPESEEVVKQILEAKAAAESGPTGN